jgi:K(+)-stimulated pyrophosphate-energized sodium pump
MSGTVETILLYTIGAGLLSIVYGFLTGKNILNSSAGMQKCKILHLQFKLVQKHI